MTTAVSLWTVWLHTAGKQTRPDQTRPCWSSLHNARKGNVKSPQGWYRKLEECPPHESEARGSSAPSGGWLFQDNNTQTLVKMFHLIALKKNKTHGCPCDVCLLIRDVWRFWCRGRKRAQRRKRTRMKEKIWGTPSSKGSQHLSGRCLSGKTCKNGQEKRDNNIITLSLGSNTQRKRLPGQPPIWCTGG